MKDSNSYKSTTVKNYTNISDKAKKKKNKSAKYNPPQQLEQLKDNHPTLQDVVDGKYKIPSVLTALSSTDDYETVNRTREMFESLTKVQSRSINSQSSSRSDKYVPILVS